ncbi:MAG: hypothetical protein M1835_007974 [Candelina submexicana]|nr:MAG: hypothetical protein M1835_007974 [Candelina submexicana]
MATVTIDKISLETLLRRAEFHAPQDTLRSSADSTTVTIPRVDHQNLMRWAKEYYTLREALFGGGISTETLELLVNGNGVHEQGPSASIAAVTGNNTEDGGVAIKQPVVSSVEGGLPAIARGNAGSSVQNDSPNHGNGGWRLGEVHGGRQQSFSPDDAFSPLDGSEHYLNGVTISRPEKQQIPRNDQRTVLMTNLSDRAIHKDVIKVIRGGALLDIFLRTNDRSASISFVDGVAAQEFINYVKRNDIYIHGKRVEVRWNDRQFNLPNHVAGKIGIGATRNLVLRNINDKVTDARLRDDLDHIHNLVVIDITFENGCAYISLNSVHNALFARTCMMSRGSYKGMRIEWYPDECAAPLPKPQPMPKRSNGLPPSDNSKSMVNRFNLLNMEGTEDGSEADDEDPNPFPNYDRHLGWADNAIAA